MTNAVNLASAAGTGFFRNRIINGAMEIDQRNGGSAVTINNTFALYTVDRFLAENNSGGGTFTVQQSTDVPTGFKNSLVVTVTAVDSSLGATDRSYINHRIEGNNIADLSFGTAAAKTVTLSFWVKSSITGTYGGTLLNDNATRCYPFTYTINTTNTWEYKTITVVGEPSGTWQTSAGIGMQVLFGLAVGPTYSGAPGAWTSTLVLSANGAGNFLANSGATWRLTGVQLEVGSVATPFERRLYGQELALCQRYYQTYPNTITYRATPFSSSFAVRQTGMLCVPMRAAPSVTVTTSGIGNQNTTTTVIGTFNTHVQFEAVTPNSSAWGNPHYDVAYNASAEL